MPKIIKTTGSAVDVWGLFSHPISKAYVDPTTLEFKVRTPANIVSTYVYGVDAEIVRDTTGNYRYNLALTERGTYHWKWLANTALPNAVVIDGTLDSVSTF